MSKSDIWLPTVEEFALILANNCNKAIPCSCSMEGKPYGDGHKVQARNILTDLRIYISSNLAGSKLKVD